MAVGIIGCTADEPTTASREAMDAAAGDDNATAEKASMLIDEEFIRDIIAELSADKYEGRGPASAGDVAARIYLAGRMADLGLEPGGPDGGWEQPFDLVGVNTVPPDTWTFAGHDKEVTFKQWDQFMINSNVQEAHAAVTDAEVVFVGYGIQAPEFEWDDYKDVDVSGKIVLMMNNDPDWDADLFAGKTHPLYRKIIEQHLPGREGDGISYG